MNKTTSTPKPSKKNTRRIAKQEKVPRDTKKETEKPENSLLSPNTSITITLKKEVVKKKYNEVLKSLSKKIKLDIPKTL